MPASDEQTSIQQIYAALTRDETRNVIISNDVMRALEEGRSPILITGRKEHLTTSFDASNASRDTLWYYKWHGGESRSRHASAARRHPVGRAADCFRVRVAFLGDNESEYPREFQPETFGPGRKDGWRPTWHEGYGTRVQRRTRLEKTTSISDFPAAQSRKPQRLLGLSVEAPGIEAELRQIESTMEHGSGTISTDGDSGRRFRSCIQVRDRAWRCDGIVRGVRAVERGRDGAGAGARFGGGGEAVGRGAADRRGAAGEASRTNFRLHASRGCPASSLLRPGLAPRKDVEAILVVPEIVLRLELDSDTQFATFDVHPLATLYPRAGYPSDPVEDLIPACLELTVVERASPRSSTD